MSDEYASLSPEEVPEGHPPGLYMMFFAELWERFCYYGMRALLAVYVVDAFGKAQEEASLSYGAFTALVYATGIFGGYVADKVIGYRRSILLGGLIMAVGEFALIVRNESAFLMGLALIVVGNGLFKPNISSLVGKLYKQGDPRRDSGFTIFYMGINIGALIAPLVCAGASRWIPQMLGQLNEAGEPIPDYRWGFGLAGIGMLAGMLTFYFGKHRLEGHGAPPEGRSGPGPVVLTILGCIIATPLVYGMLAKQEVAGHILMGLAAIIVGILLYTGFKDGAIVRDRMFALLILLFANTIFWSCFEQAGNSLNFFARDYVRMPHIDLWFSDFDFLFEWFQSVNPVFIVALGPVFAWLWVTLARKNANPSIPAKFGLGLIQVALGFGVIIYAIEHMIGPSGRVPFLMLVLLYFLHTTGELCLSPVGLSMVTKLAPERMTGFVMGAWFLSISMAQYMAGLISALAGKTEGVGDDAAVPIANYTTAYQPIFYYVLAAGALLLILSRLINKLMHGIK